MGQKLGHSSVALVSAGGMEKKKDEVTAKQLCRMRYGRGVGPMEEQGAIVTLQSRGKTSCGDGRSPPAHARYLGGNLSEVT